MATLHARRRACACSGIRRFIFARTIQEKVVDELWKAVVLGVVQGITEFLPISSTGHLIVFSALLQFQALDNTFEIFIQLGSVLAVLVYYSRELWQQVRQTPGDRRVQRLWLNLILAFIPAGMIGFLLRDWIDAVLFSPLVVALSLIVGGGVFLVVERRQPPAQAQISELLAVTPRQALLIGFAQTMALIPGVSRSGASIVGGMLAGLNRQVATQFSFYLAIPTLGIATVFSLVRRLDALNAENVLLLLVGTVVSAVVSWLAIRWLLTFVARRNFVSFGYYRLVAGASILLLLAAGILQAS
ncbi:MAG: undecaprenyl-diphosphate phosphatase [Chloroflexi bacterium]|nr:undecaprenyl-diphosphate phosphatase [Chloroflexota bacterium]